MSDATDQQFVDLVNASIEHALPIAQKMGVKAIDVRRGFAATEVPVEGNGNHFGVMYAGVLFTVAEILGGAIAVASFDTAKFFPLVKDIQIKFRRPAATAVRAEATLDEATIGQVAADAEANGKADFELDAEVTDENGVVVATTHGIYQLRAHGK